MFKGHKISEPNFGDRVKTKNSKSTKKSLNHSIDKNIKKRVKKTSAQLDKKSYKGTPQKIIDFSAYLKNSKKNSRNNYQTINKNEISKSGSALGSKKKKKSPKNIKHKETMDRILTKYNFKTNTIMKNLKKDTKTPRIADRILNVKLGVHKSSNVNLSAKTKVAQNSSFYCRNMIKRENRRNASSSSSPEIRTTPSNININKKGSCHEFGYVNPKRKSLNNTKQIRNMYEKKYNFAIKPKN